MNTQDINSGDLGRYVHAKRREAGLTLRQLAEAVGVHHSWISRLERGEYATPDARSLARLARGLDVETADLYLAAGYEASTGLPGLEPYLRAKYDYLPQAALDQLSAHFALINDKYLNEQEGGRHGRDHH